MVPQDFEQTGPTFSARKPSRKGTIFLVSFLLVSLAAAGGLGYFYWQEQQRSHELNSQLSNTKNRLATSEEEKRRLQEAADSEEEPAAKDTSYTPQFGKFSLKLPEKYSVVQHIDGKGEGGQLTRVTIGLKDVRQSGVTVIPYFFDVTVSARPSLDTSLADWIKSYSSDRGEAAPQADTKVDGTTAKVYDFNGLTSSRSIFFEKADQHFVIELGSVGEPGTSILNDVVKGFSFKD